MILEKPSSPRRVRTTEEFVTEFRKVFSFSDDSSTFNGSTAKPVEAVDKAAMGLIYRGKLADPSPASALDDADSTRDSSTTSRPLSFTPLVVGQNKYLSYEGMTEEQDATDEAGELLYGSPLTSSDASASPLVADFTPEELKTYLRRGAIGRTILRLASQKEISPSSEFTVQALRLLDKGFVHFETMLAKVNYEYEIMYREGKEREGSFFSIPNYFPLLMEVIEDAFPFS